MCPNGVVPASSGPYYVGNENGGESVKAHVDSTLAAARTRMVGTVWMFATARELGRPTRLLPVSELADIVLSITRHWGWSVL